MTNNFIIIQRNQEYSIYNVYSFLYVKKDKYFESKGQRFLTVDRLLKSLPIYDNTGCDFFLVEKDLSVGLYYSLKGITNYLNTKLGIENE